MKDWILEEAYRPVTLREGDQVIQLPAIQAVLRSMGVSAMKGDRAARKLLTELVQNVEKERRDLQFEMFQTAVKYKEDAEAEIERCRQEGLPEPEIIPHPDDIIIDPRRGIARIVGAMSKEDKRAVDRAVECQDNMIDEIGWLRRQMQKGPGFQESLIETNEKLIDRLNSALPARNRRTADDAYDDKGRKRRNISVVSTRG